MKEEKLIILDKDYNIDNLDTLVDEAINKGYGDYVPEEKYRYLNFLVTKEQCDKAEALIAAKVEKFTPNYTEQPLEKGYQGEFTEYKSYSGIRLSFLIREQI